jgi:hypothetical protein
MTYYISRIQFYIGFQNHNTVVCTKSGVLNICRDKVCSSCPEGRHAGKKRFVALNETATLLRKIILSTQSVSVISMT